MDDPNINEVAFTKHEKQMKKTVLDGQQPEFDLFEHGEKQEKLLRDWEEAQREEAQREEAQNNIISRKEIKEWRPQKFSDFAGATNRRRIRRLQNQLLKGMISTPLLIIGIYGIGKTSLARLILKSLNCINREPETADPCWQCSECKRVPRLNWGMGAPYRIYINDCANYTRNELLAEIAELRIDNQCCKPAIFYDELHRLHEKSMQEAMLTFTEDFHGIMLAAVMEDRYGEISPALLERFEKMPLEKPTPTELLEHYLRKMAEWEINSTPETVEFLVEAGGQSLRECQRVIAAAADEEGRNLTIELVEDMLALDS